MKVLILLLCLISIQGWSRTYYSAPFIFAGTTAAVLVGTEAAIYNSLVETELKSWSHKNTGSTVELESQCGVEAELHLTGSHRRNMLLMGISNSSKNSKVIKLRDVKFIYNQKRERFPGYTYETTDTRINPGWWQITWVPFPSKDEFKDVNDIQVEIPIVDEKSGDVCYLKSDFSRTGKIKEEEISYSAFEFILDGGGSLAQSGKVKELGDPNGLISMEFNFYPHPNHGGGMVFTGEFGFSGGDNPKISEEFNDRTDYSVGISYFGLQYVYRYFFKETLYLSFAIGPGFQFIYDEWYDRRGNDEGTVDFALADKLMLNWTFYRWKNPGTDLDFFTGVGLNHFWAPSADINGQNVSGHRLGGLLRIGMGF